MSVELIATDFREYCCEKLNRNLGQIVRCAGLLTAEELWQRPNERSNAIGNLIIHLTGNVGQWIMDGIAGETYPRDRDAEFAQRAPLDTERIVSRLEAAVARAIKIISELDAESLEQRRSIQSYDVSVLRAVLHVVEHFSWHAGQIVYAAKAIRDVDLSLYDAVGGLLEPDGGDKSP